jgi:hypothetical protein
VEQLDNIMSYSELINPSFLVSSILNVFIENSDKNLTKPYDSALALTKDNKIVERDGVYEVGEVYQEFPIARPRPPKNDAPFEYPMLPEKPGFSLYGEMQELGLEDATGDFVLDANPITIGARSFIRFHGISDVRTGAGSLSVLPDGGIDFRAKSESVEINNDPAYTYIDKYRRIISILGFLASFSFLAVLVFKIFCKDTHKDDLYNRKKSES